ncbi:MAG: hypothetical protein ACPLSA_08450, partial [Caldanaerobacter sp.]
MKQTDYFERIRNAIANKDKSALSYFYPQESLFHLAMEEFTKEELSYILKINPYVFGRINTLQEFIRLLDIPDLPVDVLYKHLSRIPYQGLFQPSGELTPEQKEKLLNVVKFTLRSTINDDTTAWRKCKILVSLINLLPNQKVSSDTELNQLLTWCHTDPAFSLYLSDILKDLPTEVKKIIFHPEAIIKTRNPHTIYSLDDDVVREILEHPAFKKATAYEKAVFIVKIPLIWNFPKQAVAILNSFSKLQLSTCKNIIAKIPLIEIPDSILEKLSSETIYRLILKQKEELLTHNKPFCYLNPEIARNKLSAIFVAYPEVIEIANYVFRAQELYCNSDSVPNL